MQECKRRSYGIIHCNQFIIPSKATACDITLISCSCLTINYFSLEAEMVAVETSIDVGNILWIFYAYDCFSYIEFSNHALFVSFTMKIKMLLIHILCRSVQEKTNTLPRTTISAISDGLPKSSGHAQCHI